jgi:hypothetical protein
VVNDQKELPPLAEAARTGRHICGGSEMLSYTDEELEFLRAMDEYKRQYRRPFPAWHEVLAVLKSLGYSKPVSGI